MLSDNHDDNVYVIGTINEIMYNVIGVIDEASEGIHFYGGKRRKKNR